MNSIRITTQFLALLSASALISLWVTAHAQSTSHTQKRPSYGMPADIKEPTLADMHAQITVLFHRKQWLQAEPLMRRYIEALNQQNAPVERRQQAYESYSSLLQLLNRPVEAKAAASAAKALRPRNGVVGFTFHCGDALQPYITEVFHNMPAANAGMQVEDQIIAIGRTQINKHMDKGQILDLICGLPGSNVEMTLLRKGGGLYTITMKRVAIRSLRDKRIEQFYLED